MSMQTDPLLQFFDDGGTADLSRLGGKGMSLVTMTDAGMPVPPGFIVTTAAYDLFIDQAHIREDIHRLLDGLNPSLPAEVDNVSAEIREEICSRPVPEALRESTRSGYDSLQSRFPQTVPVAVRSSATAEDLPDASFAGQQDTYLWLCSFADVSEHIRKCWASLYTSRAIIYRLKNGIPEDDLSMGVVVQKMVNARVAGVAMTLDPGNGDRSKITIDASYGLGETVVSGTVTPDHLKLDKVTLSVVSQHIGAKQMELIPDAGSKTLHEHPVEAERRDRLCLTPEELTTVATMAKRAEKHYGLPQDVEWALDADLPAGENLMLLQARPETVHANRAPGEPAPTAAISGAIDLSSLTASMLKNFT
ncbi:PEP/pyruvate-binding domain-containing protein [Nesterenkonia sp. AY15]|uniref:PEP/pyruvate-binding domain-containing protein n=1 Tax=Nesterenkonia sp. AY15 TaxID=2901139 RepID=UPI00314533F0